MKHIINYTTPITSAIIKDFTISDAETYPCINKEKMENKTSWSWVWLNHETYNHYKEENKVYYIHYYNIDGGLQSYYNTLNKNIDSVIKELIFVYVEDDKESPYHALIINDFDNAHATDITYALRDHYIYWNKMYIPSRLLPDSIQYSMNNPLQFRADNSSIEFANDNMSYFYDTKDEAEKAVKEYVVGLIRNTIIPTQIEYHTLTTDYTYKRLFEKKFNERVESLKQEITNDLETYKNVVTEELNEYTEYLTKFNELLNV